MRLGRAIFVASMAALLALARRASPRMPTRRRANEQPASSSSCHSYQQAADGSWIELPCQEIGVPAQPPHKSATRKTDQETR